MNVSLSFILLAVLLPSTAPLEHREIDKQKILDAHNRYRQEVGSPDLEWDDALAEGAAEWAEKLAKSGCRIRHSTVDLGENIYWYSGKATEEECVDFWGAEKKYFKNGKFSAKSGHYSQMVWKETTKVGCACAVGPRDCGEVWVCRYSPMGNKIGEKAY